MAQVIELQKAKLIKNERYLIDTNVWFWSTYVASKGEVLPQQPSQYQIDNYPHFLERLLQEGAILCHTALCLTELANVIERTQFDLYKLKTNQPYLEKKDFRKIADERKIVLDAIQIAWETINEMSTCIDCNVNLQCMKKSSDLMAEAPVDPYDAIYLKTMALKKIDYLVSDDIDFINLKNIILITANPKGFPRRH